MTSGQRLSGFRNSPRRGVKRERYNYMADFETTTDANDCRVWLWGFAQIDDPDNIEWGVDIDSFIERVARYNTTTYFHNLRFDGHFIIDYLLKNGFTHVTTMGLQPMEFKSLISDLGMWYTVTVKWSDGHQTEFRDSIKKLPMSVMRIAQSWKFDEGKGEIDYHAYRAPGHQPTLEELDYLRRDISIVAKALKSVIDEGMTKLTVASDSLAEYKRLVGEKYFSRMFPTLSVGMDSEIRRAYRGGFTYADERFKGKVTRSGLVLDVNSLYPSVMVANILPYGHPQWCEGRVLATPDYPLTVFSVTFTAKIKPNHIPCIQIKGSSMFGGTEYLKVIKEPVTLMVTNVDWDLYNSQYDIDVIAWGGGWRFHATEGMFDTYIEKWSAIKASETGGKREVAKLHLNALYGRFATNPNVASKIPVLDGDRVRLVRGMDDTRPPVYTAVGVFITSYARDLTIRAAQENYSSFAYADTDSLHLLQDHIPDTIDVHPTKLGAWKHEYNFAEAFYIRPKAYLERKHDGSYVNAIAGLPVHASSKLTFDDLVEGKLIDGKKTQRSVAGGVVLKDIPFMLKLS